MNYEENYNGYKMHLNNILENCKVKLSELIKQVNKNYSYGNNKNDEGLKLFIIEQKIYFIYHQISMTSESLEALICEQIKLLNQQYSFPKKLTKN